MRTRVENEQPVIVPVVTNPMVPDKVPLPTWRPDGGGAPMAPAAPVAPASAPTMQANMPRPAPAAAAPAAAAPDLRMMGPSELAASARQMYKEPGNAFSAFGQGMMNASALRDAQKREIGLADQAQAQKLIEQQKAEAEAAKQLDYLRRVNPELAQAAELGFMTMPEAYETHKTDKAKGINRKLETFPDGTVAWVYPDTGDVVPVGNYAKPQDANSAIGKLAQDYENGMINEEQYKQGLADMAPKGMVIESDGAGGFRMVQGAGVGSGGKMNVSEANANIYASRMEKAEPILSKLEKEGTSLWNSIASGVPVAGNYALSPEYRQYEQAKRDFINATLRKESGAVIADSEFANAEKQYFPQPGDDPATIAQKKENRRTATIAIRQATGQESLSEQTPADASGEEQPAQEQAVTDMPEPGTVVDGYTFKGGDPADPASWERAM